MKIESHRKRMLIAGTSCSSLRRSDKWGGRITDHPQAIK